MTNQQILYLAWENVFAAANNHLFQASHDIDVALLIHRCQVARVQPAVGIYGLGGLIRHVIVTCHHREAPATKFSFFPTWHNLAGHRIDDLDVQVRVRNAHRR